MGNSSQHSFWKYKIVNWWLYSITNNGVWVPSEQGLSHWIQLSLGTPYKNPILALSYSAVCEKELKRPVLYKGHNWVAYSLSVDDARLVSVGGVCVNTGLCI